MANKIIFNPLSKQCLQYIGPSDKSVIGSAITAFWVDPIIGPFVYLFQL